MKSLDDNARLQAGTLPEDPFEDTEPMEVPRTAEQTEARPGPDLDDLARPLSDPCWGSAGWLNERPTPRPMLLAVQEGKERKPFLPAGKVALLAAPGGAGKTQALAQLALAVASASPASGERTPWLGTYLVDRPAGDVLFVCGEEDRDEIRRRLQRAARGLNLDEAAIARAERHLWPLPLYGIDPHLVNPDGTDSAFLWKLQAYLRKPDREWALIILDPGSRFMGKDDEKDNAAATAFVERVERLTQAPGSPAVMLAVHSGKQGVRDREDMREDDQYLTRGASALVDGARWAATLRWNPKLPGFLRFLHTKSNYTKRAKPLDLVMTDEGFLRKADREEIDKAKAAKKAEGTKTGGTSSPSPSPDEAKRKTKAEELARGL